MYKYVYIHIYIYIPVLPVRHYHCPDAGIAHNFYISYIFLYVQGNKKTNCIYLVIKYNTINIFQNIFKIYVSKKNRHSRDPVSPFELAFVPAKPIAFIKCN